ncbi:hypothetical protein K435DRAFT_812755 [Dendrothele bispora CBS 962.96]|uniref:Uncharacterized protein n=1 Tax=Dendrothele bispora (strain CBS 962.96) TaxID=1314807 RepID=A0A4S8KNG2_DENBC|nr:hypothetical protein K435DRAFT_812755 [Dendrothele bispora CBS 962.96]
MPNKYRKIAGGDPLYTSFIDHFGDDVSGNRSKSWNKHNNSYITHRNLPRKLLQQEFHIHLVSTSQHATITEQYHDIKKVLNKTHTDPVCVEDENGFSTRFMLRSAGNHPCCKCDAGETEVEKSSDLGFHAMFEPGNPRSCESIKNELEAQIKLACTGIAKPIETRQTNSGTKDVYTQYWIDHYIMKARNEKSTNPSKPAFLTTEGFDPAKDTPVEILHTILLGIVKYIWHYSNLNWKPAQKQIYAKRLQATDVKGLSINRIRADYIVDFANSLVGRQLKTIIQTAVFDLHDLVDEDHFKLWKVIGLLSALLWVPEIDDMDQYCIGPECWKSRSLNAADLCLTFTVTYSQNDLHIAIANVLDMFAEVDPTKIIRKAKLHLLTHIPDDARGFGPLVGMATEIFESLVQPPSAKSRHFTANGKTGKP